MSKLYDVEDYIDVFEEIMTSRKRGNTVISILKKIKEELDKEEMKEEKDSYLEFRRLINIIMRFNCSPAIFILKNNLGNFDFYIYKKGIMACLDSLVSSEAFFIANLKSNIDGFVIENVKPIEALNFLKAYYIFRDKPELDREANNPVIAYNKRCLEMSSTLEKFDGYATNQAIQLENIVLYDDDALPYSLDYLDACRDNNDTNKDFDKILANVCEDKYLGTNLSKGVSWW